MFPEERGSGTVTNDNTQTIVLVHYRDAGETIWEHDYVNFDRVPGVGEYFQRERDGDWYAVKVVLHMAYPLDYDAELYAIRVPDRFEILNTIE